MADTKVSALSQVTTLEGEDQVYVVETDAGPASAKATIDQIRNLITPRGYIWGLRMANDAGDTANDIEVQPGEAMAESHDAVMTLSAVITKRLDAAWAVGDNQGGLNTGGEAASTWYEVHLIKRTDTGVVDVMFTTTGNRATLPANYTKQRRIGWIRNDGSSNLLQFTQVEDHFTLTTQATDVNNATITTTATAVTLTAPPNSIARFRCGATSNASVVTNEVITFSEIVEGNITPAAATGIASIGFNDIVGCSAGHFELRVNGSSQIEHDSSLATGSPTFGIATYGWIDHRRRLDEF